jgi:hypothetical protein
MQVVKLPGFQGANLSGEGYSLRMAAIAACEHSACRPCIAIARVDSVSGVLWCDCRDATVFAAAWAFACSEAYGGTQATRCNRRGYCQELVAGAEAPSHCTATRC